MAIDFESFRHGALVLIAGPCVIKSEEHVNRMEDGIARAVGAFEVLPDNTSEMQVPGGPLHYVPVFTRAAEPQPNSLLVEPRSGETRRLDHHASLRLGGLA